MALGKYYEDNRDFIEERWALRGSFSTPVINYTCDIRTDKKNSNSSCGGRVNTYGAGDVYAHHRSAAIKK